MSFTDAIKHAQSNKPNSNKQSAARHWRKGTHLSYPARGSIGQAHPIVNFTAGTNPGASNKALKTAHDLAQSGDKGQAPEKLYRGTSQKEGLKYAHLKVGDKIEHIAPTSWTRKESMAHRYATIGPSAIGARTHKTILHLTDTHNLTHHVDIENAADGMSNDYGQHETLLSGVHKMKVHKIEHINGIKHIHVKSLGQDAKGFGVKALKSRYSSGSYLAGRAASFGFKAGTGAAAGAFVHHLVRKHEQKVQGTKNPKMASTGTYAKHGAEINTGLSLAGQLVSDAHLVARVAKPFVKMDTPIQRLVKTQYLESMKDKDYLGDARDGGLAYGAGYLLARRNSLHRWPAKLIGTAAAGTVLAIKNHEHYKDIDRAIPQYSDTK